MPRLMEYQGKELFQKNGIAVPKGRLAQSPEEAKQIAKELGAAVAIKAQVLMGKRGKAGAIKFAKTPEEAEKLAQDILALEIQNVPVKKVLVEEKLDIRKEIYMGVTSSDATRAPVALFSLSGGMDIEEVAKSQLERIATWDISISRGFHQYDALNMLRKVKELSSSEINSYAQILTRLYTIYRQNDCKLVEINPLVVTDKGIFAADARIDIDDDAVWRHPELGMDQFEEAGAREPTALEIAAGQIDKNDHRGSAHFVQIDPDASRAKEQKKIPIAYHCVGAGCAITLFDEIYPLGYSPLDFCDTSGNPTSLKLYAAVKIILSQPEIRGYLFVTGMAAQLLDNTARGIIKALKELYPKTGGKPNIPCVFAFRGRSDDVAVQLFKDHGISDSPWVRMLRRDFSEKTAAEEFNKLYKKWEKETGGI
ncbi:MAG TPA: ATP-grasp domain-containing protein [Desulfatiglandales bacterium]|nr:ATP-grasp domain-containing protein [Desulfatiglandales bacterium]